MRLKSMLFGAGAAMLISAGVANAAVVTNDLNLRAGPGTDYHIIGTMPAGADIAVLSCSGTWCHVDWNGEQGYASRNFIASIRSYTYGQNDYYSAPYYYYGYNTPYFGYDDDFGLGPEVTFGRNFDRGEHFRHFHSHDRDGHFHHGEHFPVATLVAHSGRVFHGRVATVNVGNGASEAPRIASATVGFGRAPGSSDEAERGVGDHGVGSGAADRR